MTWLCPGSCCPTPHRRGTPSSGRQSLSSHQPCWHTASPDSSPCWNSRNLSQREIQSLQRRGRGKISAFAKVAELSFKFQLWFRLAQRETEALLPQSLFSQQITCSTSKNYWSCAQHQETPGIAQMSSAAEMSWCSEPFPCSLQLLLHAQHR